MDPTYYGNVLNVGTLLYVSLKALKFRAFSDDVHFNSRLYAIFKEDSFSGSFLVVCDAAFSSVQGSWTLSIGI
jgi:hypothetical protein